MNMIKLLLVVLAVHLTLMFTGIVSVPGNQLITFLLNPTAWGTTSFVGLISDLFLLTGVAAIAIGTIITRSDIFLFGGISAVFLSFGLPLAELWSLVAAQTNSTLATLLISPIILMYLVVVIQFWRGRA